MRGIVVLGGALVLLLAGERLWGDSQGTTGRGPSRSPLASGQPAPDFVAHGPDGTSIALRDYQGRPVIINCWATWCAPCRQEMLVLQTVYDAHKSAGLAILAASQDQRGQADLVRAYWGTMGLTFAPLLDPDGRIATHSNVFLLPSTVCLHLSGTVAAVPLGAMTQAQIERYLEVIIPQAG